MKSPSTKFKIGDLAPDFLLPSNKNQEIRLSDFKNTKAVILYFYPKDETPGCTKQACSFRDQYEVFQKAGAEVIGVSSDSIESHKTFSSRHNLPFILLSDRGGQVRKLYGVPTTMGVLPGRVTFVIDQQGIIRHVFSSQFRAHKHVDEALKIISQPHS